MRLVTALPAVVIAACSQQSSSDREAIQSSPATSDTHMTMDQVQSAIIRAGIPKTDIAPDKDEDGSVDVWRLSPSDGVFEKADKPALAKLVLDSHFAFSFAVERQQKAFAKFVVAEMDRRDKAKAAGELTAAKTLATVPRYDGSEPMRVFAIRLEGYCGYSRGEALRVIDGQWLEYNNPALVNDMALAAARNAATGDRSIERFRCLKRVVDATDLKQHFIGNRKERAL